MVLLRELSHRSTNYCPRFLLSLIGRTCKLVKDARGGHRPFAYSYRQTSYSKIYLGLIHMPCHFSTTVGAVLIRARDFGKLHEQLENAIDERRLEDAWDLHEKHMRVDGFARKSTLAKLISCLTETLELQWVERAYGLVEKAIEENKHTLFDREILMFLSLGLAKCGLSVPSTILLRKLIESKQFPPVAAWSAIIAYMLGNSSGAYLAAELTLEIGYLFQDARIDPRKKVNEPLIAMKPNVTAFSIALVACLLFETTRKAEQLLEMMPRINLRPDATLLIIMAHVYERNGRREDLKKIKRHIEEVHNVTDIQIQQFYNFLLSCHLKFGDLDNASGMVLEMLRKAKKAQNALGVANLILETHKNGNMPSHRHVSEKDLCQVEYDQTEKPVLPLSQVLSYEDFLRDRKFLRLEAEAKDLLDMLLAKLQKHAELITSEKGFLRPTEQTYVKLVKAFLQCGKIKDLAEFLIKVEREDTPLSDDNSALASVINSCIALGLLDQAHDLLDELRLAGIRIGSSVYGSLLKAYCKENRMADVTSLVRDARKAGIQLDASSYEAMIQSRVHERNTEEALRLFKEMKEAKIPRGGHQTFDDLVRGSLEDKETGLMAKLLQEIKEGQTVESGVHEWNNVIHFFSKKRLMQDSEKALKKMTSLGHAPNAQTFHSLVMGYSAIGGKYIEVTELWGEMKAFASSSGMRFDQELLDAVLYTFVRGGFFVRANEVVEMMEKSNMFVDKYKYRALFLKYHKTLYKGKPKFQTESQLKKREAALSFKTWVGLC